MIKKRKSVRLKVICKKHPNYKVKLRPRSDCDVCWDAYNELHFPNMMGPIDYDPKITHTYKGTVHEMGTIGNCPTCFPERTKFTVID